MHNKLSAGATQTQFVGRYAPSPTGVLHLGNLRTGLIAWLHARLHKGVFLLRMEDIDTPRVVPGSDKSILDDLAWLGLDWDGDVVYQSMRQALYLDALNDLSLQGLTYPCFCSRKTIQQAANTANLPVGVYPGSCAKLTPEEIFKKASDKQAAIRVRVSGELQHSCGDVVLRRADGLIAYQLAVVVDDLAQGITDVVRGDDLSGSTARQQYLARLLEPSHVDINYHHTQLMMGSDGKKLSKRDGSFSAVQWREAGRTAEELVGFLAKSAGLLDTEEPITATDLLHHLSSATLSAVLV